MKREAEVRRKLLTLSCNRSSISLIYKIADKGNTFFYKRIIEGYIERVQLVTMTAFELASEEVLMKRETGERMKLLTCSRKRIRLPQL